jgi:hypothetical protein
MNTLAKRVVLTTVLTVALAVFHFREAAADPDSQVSVTGHVEFINLNSATHNHIEYSLHAIQEKDDGVTAKGEFEERVVTAAGDFVRRTHGVITCLAVAGNVARVGGYVTEGSGSAAAPGSEVWTTLVDNGEGEDGADLDDMASPGAATAAGSGNALKHCTIGLVRPLFPVIHGNVQVRPTGL